MLFFRSLQLRRIPPFFNTPAIQNRTCRQPAEEVARSASRARLSGESAKRLQVRMARTGDISLWDAGRLQPNPFRELLRLLLILLVTFKRALLEQQWPQTGGSVRGTNQDKYTANPDRCQTALAFDWKRARLDQQLRILAPTSAPLRTRRFESSARLFAGDAARPVCCVACQRLLAT